jgi:hypothetical protein
VCILETERVEPLLGWGFCLFCFCIYAYQYVRWRTFVLLKDGAMMSPRQFGLASGSLSPACSALLCSTLLCSLWPVLLCLLCLSACSVLALFLLLPVLLCRSLLCSALLCLCRPCVPKVVFRSLTLPPSPAEIGLSSSLSHRLHIFCRCGLTNSASSIQYTITNYVTEYLS